MLQAENIKNPLLRFFAQVLRFLIDAFVVFLFFPAALLLIIPHGYLLILELLHIIHVTCLGHTFCLTWRL